MYQMYAYQKKYNAQNITLLYPLTPAVTSNNIEYDSGDGVIVHVKFVDLFDVKSSLADISKEFYKVEYKYYLLYDRWLARLEKERYDLNPKEFFKNGVWMKDDDLDRQLNDAIMDYGDRSVFDYDRISEEKAMDFINSFPTP